MFGGDPRKPHVFKFTVFSVCYEFLAIKGEGPRNLVRRTLSPPEHNAPQGAFFFPERI